MVLACYAGQNIDRLVTVYRAAKRSGRLCVLDAYGAAVAAATGRDTIPQAGWPNVREFLPHAQRKRIIEREAYDELAPFREHRIYPEQLAERPEQVVLTMRTSMTSDLDRAQCLDGASAVWSMWRGYLDEGAGQKFAAWCDHHDIPLTHLHASGHANAEDLVALARAVRAERVVPMHTPAPERYFGLFDHVEVQREGQWWSV